MESSVPILTNLSIKPSNAEISVSYSSPKGSDILLSPSSVLQSLPRNLSPTKDSSFLQGFQRFQKKYLSENKALFETLKNGQAPKTCLIGCCDSRVDPALITDCAPGDIFMVRNVANLVAPYEISTSLHGTSSALEYAVKVLKVENIIVLGHSKCGGIHALMTDTANNFEFVGPWMAIANKAKEKTLRYFAKEPEHVQVKACEQASILQSLENLVSYPWIHSRLQDGSLSLTGWYFDIEKGDLIAYNDQTTQFDISLSKQLVDSSS